MGDGPAHVNVMRRVPEFRPGVNLHAVAAVPVHFAVEHPHVVDKAADGNAVVVLIERGADVTVVVNRRLVNDDVVRTPSAAPVQDAEAAVVEGAMDVGVPDRDEIARITNDE